MRPFLIKKFNFLFSLNYFLYCYISPAKKYFHPKKINRAFEQKRKKKMLLELLGPLHKSFFYLYVSVVSKKSYWKNTISTEYLYHSLKI